MAWGWCASHVKSHVKPIVAEKFARLPEEHKALESPATYPVSNSTALAELTRKATLEVRRRAQDHKSTKEGDSHGSTTVRQPGRPR